MRTKLKQVKGETLVETLAALAIVVMAVFLLTNMLMAAARLNQKSSSLADSYQREIAIAEGGPGFVGTDDAAASGSEYFIAPDSLFAKVDGSDNFVGDVQKSIETQNGNVLISWQEAAADGTTMENKTARVKVFFVGSSSGSLVYYQAPVEEDGGDSDEQQGGN